MGLRAAVGDEPGDGAWSLIDPAGVVVSAPIDGSPEPWMRIPYCSVQNRGTGVNGRVVVGSWPVAATTADREPVRLTAPVRLRWHEIAEFSVRDSKQGATLARLPTT